MKLESLKSEKFKNDLLKREQMFTFNGGLTETTPAGTACGTNNVYPYQIVSYDFSWDSIRDGVTYFHGRSNIQNMSYDDCYAGQQGN